MTSHVKVHGIVPRIQYLADGTLTEYEFPFVIFKTSDIDVYFGDSKQDISTYSVSDARRSDGGSVTFNAPPAKGLVITIVRNLSIERTTDFQEGGALRANVLNDELDYQIACQQQIADGLNRSMVLPPYASDINVDLTLPTPSAGKAIVWNSAGTNLENSTVKVNELESTLRGYKESAKTDAETASVKSSIACEKADVATEQAQIATQKAEEVRSSLSLKTNIDMDNLTDEGKIRITSLSIPDYNSGVSKSWNTEYIAECDGLIFATASMDANGGLSKLVINNIEHKFGSISAYNVRTALSMFVGKGDAYKGMGANSAELIFYPLKGGNNA